MMPPEKTATEVVCLVDDDLAILKSIGRLLASDGLSVRAFSRPQDFLGYAHAHLVPLVILDILMEGMTGLEVQAHLRELSPRTRVIIMTGREGPTTRSAAADMGASAFFTKPFDDEQFLRAVHAALDEHNRNE
jgi:FixJ family two-component response regulator